MPISLDSEEWNTIKYLDLDGEVDHAGGLFVLCAPNRLFRGEGA